MAIRYFPAVKTKWADATAKEVASASTVPAAAADTRRWVLDTGILLKFVTDRK
jgi:cobyric acid synthase